MLDSASSEGGEVEMFGWEEHWCTTRNHGVEGECLPMECMFVVKASLSAQGDKHA